MPWGGLQRLAISTSVRMRELSCGCTALHVQSQPEVDEETRKGEHIFRRQNPPTIQQGSYQVCDLYEVELQVCV
jgi:hypothetical protein